MMPYFETGKMKKIQLDDVRLQLIYFGFPARVEKDSIPSMSNKAKEAMSTLSVVNMSNFTEECGQMRIESDGNMKGQEGYFSILPRLTPSGDQATKSPTIGSAQRPVKHK